MQELVGWVVEWSLRTRCVEAQLTPFSTPATKMPEGAAQLLSLPLCLRNTFPPAAYIWGKIFPVGTYITVQWCNLPQKDTRESCGSV